MAAEPDLPEGFETWPRGVQQSFFEELHSLYFPKLRWWEKPETDEENSGPRPKQRPPDDPRHCLPDNRGLPLRLLSRHPELPGMPAMPR